MIAITEQSKVVIKFTDSLLDTINILLNLEVGDTSRLEHIKDMILKDKPLYTSDKQYVQNLASIYINDNQTKTDTEQPRLLINCRNCSTSIPKSAKYCTLCGIRQKRESNYNISKIAKYNPIHLISRPNSYQILAIIGGLTAMLPVLFIVARMDPLILAINYETGNDISGLADVFIFLGVLSSVLSTIAIVITFVIKNPKKVGRILFFIAFGILITSILVGVLGFIFILLASNVAYKKRYY
ncbi:MAG: hypothetical protein ACREAK_08130 [Nitrosarchaeum sp.]